MTGPDLRVEDTTVVMASMTRKESAMVAPRRIYRAGTLRYTLRELVAVFFWMLLGDFCFQLSMVVFASVLPLKLKGLGASNSVIGLIVGSIPSAMNMIVLPVVSYRSDRHRGRLGRRIPYLLWPTPLIALFLAVVGFSDSLGRWLYHFLTASVHLSQATVLFWTIGLCVGLYQFFNSFVASVYYYLFNDVVPQELMGRFYGLFRVVSAGAAFIFNFFILGYAGVPAMQRWIFVGAGAMYLVAFGLMCWRVREGQYPPPPERKAQGTWLARLWTATRVYSYECFSLRHYWWYYLGTTAYSVAFNIMAFQVFFARDELKMGLGEYGKVLGVGSLLGLLLNYPLGWLSDKINAVRMNIMVLSLAFLVPLACGWAIHGPVSFWIGTLVLSVTMIAYSASSNPMCPQVLPRDQYGQFAAAASMITALAVTVASYGSGVFLDWAGRLWPSEKYRCIYWWEAFFLVVALAFLLAFYRGWKRYGGARGYKAPLRMPVIGGGAEPISVALPADTCA